MFVLAGCAPIGAGHDHKVDAPPPPDDAGTGPDGRWHPFRPDAAPDAMPDATIVQTFAVGVECGGGHCTGGYQGAKNLQGPPTADYLCTTHMFPRATSY